MVNALNNVAVVNFKRYLSLPSVQPDVDYSGCVEFLKELATGIGLPCEVVEVAPGKPVVVISWRGTEPHLSSLLLSSHMDVVPVYPDKWTHPPFSAYEDETGNIYARGSQDMKCVGIQYLEAVRRLILNKFKPKRSVHLCFTPDEEIGSHGMRMFVETETFKKLNVGCELDEGVASPDESFNLYYGERTAYRFKVVCPGTPGHGSLLLDKTAGEKLNFVIQKFMDKRAEEKKKLVDNPNLTLGDVTTINLTMVEGGVQANVVPPELSVTFDCRVSLGTDHDEFEAWLADVCQQAGEGVSLIIPDRKKRIEPTRLDDGNPWWVTLKLHIDKMGLQVKTSIFPAATDARYIRGLGIPAFGFSPMNNTPVLLHDHDEFLNVNVFLKGIEIYMNIISGMANV